VNLTATSPIVGPASSTSPTSTRRLRALCREVDPALEEGVYVQFPGPHYETPAEIAMVRTLGGDLVGMSTTLEAIAAREAGRRCSASPWSPTWRPA
jgi:purine-nucleoside phosphorylase